ncbi:MAG: hemolysin family protein [Vicinamibacterales bacterium]
MLLIVVLVACLIALNALFVAAEFAIVTAPRAAIDASAADGHRLARLVQSVLRNPKKQDRYIATAQIGVTVASLGLGMFGESALAVWMGVRMDANTWSAWLAAHGFATVAAIAILTYLHIVLGEMLPKSIALQSAGRLALVVTPVVLWLQTILLPFVAALNGLGAIVLRAVGVERQSHTPEQYYTPEELQLIVEESQERGALRADAGRMLRELFEFGELTAGEVMVPRVRISGIPVDADPSELRRILGGAPHTRYPVFEGDLDHIVGVYHIKDLLRLLLNGQRVSARGARQAPVVPETALLDSVLATMRRERAQLAIVIDEHGGTAGIVTLEDLFEEVVGEIEEGPGPNARPAPDPQGRLRVPGTMRIDDLGQLFDLDLAHEDVDSVSGLILALLGRPPRLGDSVRFERLQLDVTAVHGRGVGQAAVTLLPERPAGDQE